MYDTPKLLTLAQTRRLVRYNPRDLAILTSLYGFPRPCGFPHGSNASDSGLLMWHRSELEEWLLFRDNELLKRLV